MAKDLFHQHCVERSFTSGAPNDNFRKNICSEDDLRSRIFSLRGRRKKGRGKGEGEREKGRERLL